MFCAKCGKQVDPSSRFCPACGATIAAPPPPQQGYSPIPGQLTRSRSNRVIAGVCAGFALHYGWDITLVDTIADNASSGLFVLGGPPRSLLGLDLVACRMRMTRERETISEGSGAACLGSPLNAAVWLARTVVRLGNPLKAGDTIMTGALGPMAAVAPSQVVQAAIEGLGTVVAPFGAASVE